MVMGVPPYSVDVVKFALVGDEKVLVLQANTGREQRYQPPVSDITGILHWISTQAHVHCNRL